MRITEPRELTQNTRGGERPRGSGILDQPGKRHPLPLSSRPGGGKLPPLSDRNSTTEGHRRADRQHPHSSLPSSLLFFPFPLFALSLSSEPPPLAPHLLCYLTPRCFLSPSLIGTEKGCERLQVPRRGDVITNQRRASTETLCNIGLKKKSTLGHSDIVRHHGFVRFSAFQE